MVERPLVAVLAGPAGRADACAHCAHEPSVLLGCDAAMRAAPTETDRARLSTPRRIGSDRPSSRLGTSAWPWPESRLTYENALPAQAPDRRGALTSTRVRSSTTACASSTGSSSRDRPRRVTSRRSATVGGRAAGRSRRFDQQPIEATALLLAAESAYDVTGDDKYRAAMERAYAWFLGGNDVGVSVAVPRAGRVLRRSRRRGRQREPGSRVHIDVADRPASTSARSASRSCDASTRTGALRADGSVMTARASSSERSAANPILTAADVPYPANSVFNPGAARVGNETILLVRVEDLRGISQPARRPQPSTASRTGSSIRNRSCDPTSPRLPRRSGAAKTLGSPGFRSARSGRSPTPPTAGEGRSCHWR